MILNLSSQSSFLIPNYKAIYSASEELWATMLFLCPLQLYSPPFNMKKNPFLDLCYEFSCVQSESQVPSILLGSPDLKIISISSVPFKKPCHVLGTLPIITKMFLYKLSDTIFGVSYIFLLLLSRYMRQWDTRRIFDNFWFLLITDPVNLGPGSSSHWR